MTPEQRQGRTILIVLILFVLLISVWVMAMSTLTFGTRKLPRQLVRFVLTCILFERVYSGSVIAKWIAVVLFGAAAFLMLTFPTPSKLEAVFAIGAMEAIYLAFLWALLFSESVKQYFQYRRELRSN